MHQHGEHTRERSCLPASSWVLRCSLRPHTPAQRCDGPVNRGDSAIHQAWPEHMTEASRWQNCYSGHEDASEPSL